MNITTEKPYRIYAEVLEQEALLQFESAMNQPFTIRGALMPDAHTGYSLPIGAVVATEGVIVPAWVGYDIGCGMCALPTNHSADEIRAQGREIFERIYKAVPVGFAHNTKETAWPEADGLPCSNQMQEIFARNGLKQLGSLGGGNHFVEIGEDETGKVWLVLHSGSRGIGHATASHYMRLASEGNKAKEGHFALSVSSEAGKNYIDDLAFCLEFALANRREMMRRILDIIDSVVPGVSPADWSQLINRNHNHAELKDGMWIHRKGATHAEAGMLGVIPGNMRDGSFIVRGKGNPEALWSSSHGAGRVLGRKQAKNTLDVQQFAETMNGVIAKVSKDTLDESPFAYKSIFEVMRQQENMVETVARVRPIINIKG